MSGLGWRVGSRSEDNGEPVAAINLMGNTYPRNQCSLAQDETAPILLTFSEKNLTVLCEVTLSATLSANGHRYEVVGLRLKLSLRMPSCAQARP